MKEETEVRPPLPVPPRTFVVYIDGYNLYAAINRPETLKLGWCNYQLLAQELATRAFGARFRGDLPDAVTVQYFTALVRQKDPDPKKNTGGRKGEEDRQDLWLRVLKRETGIEPIYGEHIPVPNKERKGSSSRREKLTDVNISLAMVTDAQTKAPAGMVLISGDMDFRPAIERVVALGVPVVVFNPQDHRNYTLALKPPVPVGLFDMRYLGRDVMELCPLGCDAEWLQYLEKKAESYRNSTKDGDPEIFARYTALVEQERRLQKNRQRALRSG